MTSNARKSLPALVLGTVQLGMPYGIANKNGQPNHEIAEEIVRTALEHGIDEFDTAPGYGESEAVLGEALRVLNAGGTAKLITKLDPNLDYLDARAITDAIQASCVRLGVKKLHGVLLHREELLGLWGKGLGRILKDLVSQGYVDYVGVSVYTPSIALRALELDGLTIIQLPTNILDRRFESAGVFELAKKKSATVYIRSAFLQGLLFIDSRQLPETMTFARPSLELVEEAAGIFELTRQEFAFGYLKLAFPQAKILFGAETLDQVETNCRAWQREYPPALVGYVREHFRDINERIVNPLVWPRPAQLSKRG
ncbi:aldo/keto reductase [Candidatus Uhrbacteria bacterium]|nr:aldo/keto reductase [Candidatus Uhrbacteria bacterium]